MDIRLANGTIVQGIPDGLDADEIDQMLSLNNYFRERDEQQPRPTENDIPGHSRSAPAAQDTPEGDIPGRARPASAPQGSGFDFLDRVNALGTGVNRGLTYLPALPVDTGLNVIDLGKAALGTTYRALTGEPVPDMLTLTPREQVPLSGAWLIDQARKTQLGRDLMDPVNPKYENSYEQAIGAGLTGLLGARSWGQLAAQGANNVASTVMAKAVGDATDRPELAIAAGMSPLALKQGLAAGAKYAIRGDEAGRQTMVQNVQDLRNAGLEQPTLGLASGNTVVGAIENTLQNTPGASGVMNRARQRGVDGLYSTIEGTVGSISNPGDSALLGTGRAIQADLRRHIDGLKTRQGELDAATIGPGTERATQRAQAFKEAAEDRINRMQPLLKQVYAEEVPLAIEKGMATSPTVFQTVKKGLSDKTRAQLAGTLVDRFGSVPAGSQGPGSPPWNQETFLANSNRMNPKAREELLSGFSNADRARADVEAVGQAARRMGDNSKMWSKPSQAWADYVAKGTLGLLGVSGIGGLSALMGGGLSPEAIQAALPKGGAAMLALGGSLAAPKLAAHALTSPRVVKAVASPTTIDPQELGATLRGMAGGGFFSDLRPQRDGLFFKVPQD